MQICGVQPLGKKFAECKKGPQSRGTAGPPASPEGGSLLSSLYVLHDRLLSWLKVGGREWQALHKRSPQGCGVDRLLLSVAANNGMLTINLPTGAPACFPMFPGAVQPNRGLHVVGCRSFRFNALGTSRFLAASFRGHGEVLVASAQCTPAGLGPCPNRKGAKVMQVELAGSPEICKNGVSSHGELPKSDMQTKALWRRDKTLASFAPLFESEWSSQGSSIDTGKLHQGLPVQGHLRFLGSW